MRPYLACMLLAAWLTVGASAASAEDRYFGTDRPTTSWGLDLGALDVARIGNSMNVSAAQGDLLMQVGAHYWYRHAVELNLRLGYGVDYGVLAVGLGAKVNLLEIFGGASSRVLLKDVPGFGDTGLHQRGLLSGLIGDFMVYASLSETRYQFPAPSGSESYSPGGWGTEPGLGAQFYLGNIFRSFSRRWYIDTSLSALRYSGSFYLEPRLGIGFELK